MTQAKIDITQNTEHFPVITEEALDAIIDLAMKRKVGARGLRAIMEEFMLDIMYELPTMSDLKEVVVTREVVLQKDEPIRLLKKAL